MSTSESVLQHLIMSDVDLSAVNQDILASGSIKLSTLNLQVMPWYIVFHNREFLLYYLLSEYQTKSRTDI